MTSKDRKAQGVPAGKNRLALEKSPYLLQHADNPVDWYPWGEEAFARAKAEDKPIFLSIGYSTCHWCHVMEHESFEDPEVAALMNDAFINVKVDREERPDVDNIYMTVCQMMTRSGGWPLTILMTPDRTPFFAATYIPKEDRYGRPGMMRLIPELKNAWDTRREEVVNASTQITGQLQEYVSNMGGDATLDDDVLALAYNQLNERFDEQHAGFGNAPKFPTPHNLVFLLRYWKRTGEGRALEMVERTLEAMARGGMYDHVGFGFHRYSTDTKWFAPHFEKMLYDQALLVMAYTEAYQATGKPEYRRVADEILLYIERDMTDKGGGFHSAQDADSEGIEGKFYLWSEAELRGLLDGKDAELIIDMYGVEPSGNFSEEVPEGNILYLRRPVSTIATEHGMSEEALRNRLEGIHKTLFDAREKKIHPHKDDKILTDWNGLMIAAMAKAAVAFDEPRYAKRAETAMNFILENMRDSKGRLLHRSRDGEVGIEAKVDDYAFTIWALIEVYELTFNERYLSSAMTLNDQLVDHFWDEKRGGLFFTPDDGEDLIVRMKEVYDGAVPSGNSVAMLNFTRLSRLTGAVELEDRAVAIGNAFSQDVSRSPAAFTQLLTGLDFGVGPSYEVVIVGKRDATDTKAMQRALGRAFVPNKVVLFKPSDEKSPKIVELAAFTKSQKAVSGKATAYVCRNYACELPTTETEHMLEMLSPAK